MERLAITIEGVVQGVGFRPFVHALALSRKLTGFVKNRSGSVLIEVEGEHHSIQQFLQELQTQRPPLSIIQSMSTRPCHPVGEGQFRIEPSDLRHVIGNETFPSNPFDIKTRTLPREMSHVETSSIYIAADMAPCNDCLAELFDPLDRRYQYPFLNCTQCGPRLTIINSAPYDRERTTLARFVMCPACQAEYEDPSNRRFHAQANACPQCGPQLLIADKHGQRIASFDPLDTFIQCLRAGQIGAVKGVGGFHLTCDATNSAAVRELRQRKHRDEKPLAVMVRDVNMARTLCDIRDHEQALLESQRRPIVLLRKRIKPHTNSVVLSDAVAPNNPFLGVMLPSTPLHALLFQQGLDTPLVMTSGNHSGEPIAYLDDDAFRRLGNIADIFLTHDRPIHVRCDDSVVRMVRDEELPVRRSRGSAPYPIRLPFECPSAILAVGGQLKNVIALGQGQQAFLSQHLGDLDHFEAYRAFEASIQHLEQLFEIHPGLIAHDLHPNYPSTSYAQRRAAGERCQLMGIQHHHAHMASCMVENGLDEVVIGVTFDGTGLGTDGAIWGGEFLVGDYSHFHRAAHLRYVRMPSGEKAILEPWRMAVAHSLDADCPLPNLDQISSIERRTVEQLVRSGWNSPFTSSMGRLFDAVAAIAGFGTRNSYEGQLAMQLEWAAMTVPENGAYPFDLIQEIGPTGQNDRISEPTEFRLSPFVIDTRPLIRAVVHDMLQSANIAVIARRFHSTIVEMITEACQRIRCQTGLTTVVLSGGVFLNTLLTEEVCVRLAALHFRVCRHRLVPPGDGGLCLGQLAVAAKTWGIIQQIPSRDASKTQPADRA